MWRKMAYIVFSTLVVYCLLLQGRPRTERRARPCLCREPLLEGSWDLKWPGHSRTKTVSNVFLRISLSFHLHGTFTADFQRCWGAYSKTIFFYCHSLELPLTVHCWELITISIMCWCFLKTIQNIKVNAKSSQCKRPSILYCASCRQCFISHKPSRCLTDCSLGDVEII